MRGASAISKKKVKKIARKQAEKQVDAILPIDSDSLSDSAVTGPKIAAGAVDTGKIANSIPAARVTNSAAETTTDQVNHVLTFNQERYDTANLHSNGQNTRLTAPVTGVYDITAHIVWQGDSDGGRELVLRKNGNTIIAEQQNNASTLDPGQSVATSARLAAGDFVQAQVAQTSGTSLDILKRNQWSPEMTMTWLAPGP